MSVWSAALDENADKNPTYNAGVGSGQCEPPCEIITVLSLRTTQATLVLLVEI